jgi:hypothetical protein
MYNNGVLSWLCATPWMLFLDPELFDCLGSHGGRRSFTEHSSDDVVPHHLTVHIGCCWRPEQWCESSSFHSAIGMKNAERRMHGRWMEQADRLTDICRRRAQVSDESHAAWTGAARYGECRL